MISMHSKVPVGDPITMVPPVEAANVAHGFMWQFLLYLR